MKAKLKYHDKVTLIHRSGNGVAVAELKVWEIGPSNHYPEGIKFSLFLVQPDGGVVLFGIDNHKPKGPHLHVNGREEPYHFTDVESLIEDFWRLAAKRGYQL